MSDFWGIIILIFQFAVIHHHPIVFHGRPGPLVP